jgi:tetratricopeptide (TPR) repeat protein
MSNNRIILIIKASDIDASSLTENKRDIKSRAFKDAVYDHLLKNYGVSRENIIVHIQNDIIRIEWSPQEKDEYIDAEFQRSMSLLTDGKLEEARFILEDLAFRSPKDPNVLYNLGMVYSEFHDLDIAIDTLERCVNIVPLYSNAYVALGVAYGRQNKLKEAAVQFTKAIALDKHNSYAYRNLASILGKMGDNFNALKYLKLAYEIDAFDPHTLYGLGLAYQDMGDQVNATIFYKKLVELGTPQELVDLAKDSLRNIAVGSVKETGFRTDAMFYCLSALEKFEKMKKEDLQKIAFEIGMKGADGIDINDHSKRYTLKSMAGDFTGLQLISYMYVGFKIIAPEQNIGIDISREYNAAKQMFNSRGHTWN